ncbi:MAG: GNAT family N-acetyltransferase [Gammaproteobacteria bacterium]|nr:GNAT family N-acetyltransferase [Gammaproteobacteria bacterium]
MRVAVVEEIASLEAAAWDALSDGSQPFVRHAFLHALEKTGRVGGASGWQPWFVTLHDDRGLAAAAPAWLKRHSYGEFVFDFAWAQAYARAGLAYYPKLVVAVPFTPATGPRLLVRADLDHASTARKLLEALGAQADTLGLQTAHVLFPDARDRAVLEHDAWLLRRDCQFHWSNRGYRDFDDFLATFSADKRKKAKRERRRVAEAGVEFDTVFGNRASEAEIDAAFELHRVNFLRHGNEPYLDRACFFELAATLGESMLFKFARVGTRIVAVAVFFKSADTLYGRYWGAIDDFHSLHFETCYHQGVEFCIEYGLQRFEPGTQGEHKVSRGFEPTTVYSAHRIKDPRFKTAIADFLRREGDAIDDYAAEVRTHVPFRAP